MRDRVMADTRNSSNVNVELFKKEIGLRQLSNTSIFLKDNFFILSPSVQNAHKWFDLRKVNLDRFKEKAYKGYLLIRYFNKFLLTELDQFNDRMMPKDKYVNNHNIGIHWKFNVEGSGKVYTIINRQDRTMFHNINEVSVEVLKNIFGSSSE
jgi:hypothetical protein